jgi:tetrahydromethanopterin S-methyltransferase subunit C
MFKTSTFFTNILATVEKYNLLESFGWVIAMCFIINFIVKVHSFYICLAPVEIDTRRYIILILTRVGNRFLYSEKIAKVQRNMYYPVLASTIN